MKKILLLTVILLNLMNVVAYSAAAAEVKEWTFMVFMNGDNTLDPCCDVNLNAMAQAGGNNNLNVVAIVDRAGAPTTIVEILPDNLHILKTLPESDMGDYNVLTDFVKTTVAEFPARHYALIIWSHGDGWKGPKTALWKGISGDNSSGNHISTTNLGIALNEIKAALGKNLDILAMDACLMQMIEVAFAIRKSCDFVIASEEVVPPTGFPYDRILRLFDDKTSGREISQGWVKAYADFYQATEASSYATLSAIDCSRIDALRDAVDGFSKAIMSGHFESDVKEALFRVQKFQDRENIDLVHFVAVIKSRIQDIGVQTSADKLDDACTKAIIANGAGDSLVRNAYGLAIYCPESANCFSPDYGKSDFAKSSMWDDMLLDYYKKVTGSQIVADIEKHDISSLKAYLTSVNIVDRELTEDLISRLNFRVFAEGGFPEAFIHELTPLINELKYSGRCGNK